MWAALARFVLFQVIGYLLTPKQPDTTPKAATSVDGVPRAEAGAEIPIIYGTVWITGPQVAWSGDMRSAPIKAKAGKK